MTMLVTRAKWREDSERKNSWGFAAFSRDWRGRVPCTLRVSGPLRPPQAPFVTQDGLKAGVQKNRKEKKTQGDFPCSLCVLGAPFLTAQAGNRGSWVVSVPPYCPSQVSGCLERPARGYWFGGILNFDLLPQFTYYCILSESSNSRPLHSVHALQLLSVGVTGYSGLTLSCPEPELVCTHTQTRTHILLLRN